MNGVGERRQVRPALIGPSLRMNGVSEKGRVKERETETETERDRETHMGVCSRVWQIFIFYRSFYILS